MITQAQYSDAILRASMVNADYISGLINQEASGCMTNWGEAICIGRKISSAAFCYSINDFSSDDSLSLYDTLMAYAGLQYINNLIPDPNAQPIDGNEYIIEGGSSYTPPANIVLNIPANSASPFVYNYGGTNMVKDYYVEQSVDGQWQKSNIQQGVSGNSYIVASSNQDSGGNFVFLDNYRLTLELA